ncbi:MAG: hypothetical protein ABR529_07480 [Actinomycetota bacterium]
MASTQPVPLWKYPLRAAGDVVIMVLGLLLAFWPLVALVFILKLIF